MSRILFAIAFLVLTGCMGSNSSQDSDPHGLRALAMTSPTGVYNLAYFKSSNGQNLPYRMLLPVGFDPARAYPLVLWLHGSGEMGSNGYPLGNGTEAFETPENLAKYPAIILVPQCPLNDRWSKMGAAYAPGHEQMPAQPTPTAASTLELVDSLRAALHVDAAHVMVAGLSLGGFGVYDFLARRPDLFVAGLPLSGGGDTSKAPILARKAIWDFHGSNDGVVGVSHSRVIIAAIRTAGGHPLYTEIPGGQHGPWSPILARADVMAWLFANH